MISYLTPISKSLFRMIKTTKNWPEVLLIYTGLKKKGTAVLRTVKKIPVCKDKWSVYWEKTSEKLILHFPSSINYVLLREIFCDENYKKLNINNKIVIDIGAYIGDTSIYFAIKGAKKF